MALLLAALSAAGVVVAQDNVIHDPQVASLQVMAGSDWQSLPVVRLGGSSAEDVVNIGFDCLTHENRRLTYSVEHCDADWRQSDSLFPSDYVEGFAEGNTIDDCAQSVNTNTQYTHYSLSLPNGRCRLTMSGNYRVRVFDSDDGDREVLSACFMVVEPLAAVGLKVCSNTDIDTNRSHQQVSMTLGYGSLRVANPSQIRTVIMQNRRTDNAVRDPKPQAVTATGMEWTHCRDLVFPAGNEYRKFEVLNVSHPSMGIDRMEWDGGMYNAYPVACGPRPSYVYDEDADGAFCIRNSDDVDNDTRSDYVRVHYRLLCPPVEQGKIYVNGAWTGGLFTPEYEMTYNAAERCYKAAVMQKFGYYSYQFVLRDSEGRSLVLPSEGSFWQTENTYQTLVYFRGQGERADRLVGYAQARFTVD